MIGGYLERHWRGELSLGVSFWLNHVLLGAIGGAVMSLGVAWVRRASSEVPVACLFFTLAVLVLWVGAQSWQILGTWRSATRAREIRRWRRASIVQALLSFSVLASVLQILALLLPIGRAVFAGGSVAVPGTMLREGGRVIEFEGAIGTTSAVEFGRVLDASRPVVVRLSSEGGLVAQARQIAAMIRARGLDTEVERRCVSACTIVFFAGRNRLLQGSGTLGFHSYASAALTPQALVSIEEFDRQTYLAGGVAPNFVDSIFAVPPAKLWFPSKQQAEAAGFATGSR
ncbi:hypothetical protein [Rhodopila sp.]|uniref:hypothetical protein n=1 Tax=Rhodopila sp. TaxID=2480087 RepID=UPI003D149792